MGVNVYVDAAPAQTVTYQAFIQTSTGDIQYVYLTPGQWYSMTFPEGSSTVEIRRNQPATKITRNFNAGGATINLRFDF